MTRKTQRLEAQLTSKIGESFSQGIQALGRERFSKWVIRRGMEFGSPWIWWGDVNKTRAESYGGGPHEGLDFALAENKTTGRLQACMEGLHVPAFTDGTVLWRFPDLVGDTVIVATDQRINDQVVVIQYSHIDFENAQIGDRLSQGHDIGKVTLSRNPKSITASHLHLSIGLIDQELLERPDSGVDFSTWLEWDRCGKLIYCDPLQILNSETKDRYFRMGRQAQSRLSCLINTGDSKEDRLELRRILARNFPGIQSLSKKTTDDATALQRSDGLLVDKVNGSWNIQSGPDLNIPEQTLLKGDSPSKLIDAIAKIEAANQP